VHRKGSKFESYATISSLLWVQTPNPRRCMAMLGTNRKPSFRVLLELRETSSRGGETIMHVHNMRNVDIHQIFYFEEWSAWNQN
jgi:hypothetical protein